MTSAIELDRVSAEKWAGFSLTDGEFSAVKEAVSGNWTPDTIAEVASAIREKNEESVRGCSCGMADYGEPGHDGDPAGEPEFDTLLESAL
ncbi:hypothetical protein ACIP5N_32865 [Streptomyces sp. NPDC088768]|uniref:hypothetical protein n=1 Tax=Streptomyces sp. NPDC088768 TaxID=3365894 RepID=UPI0037FFFBD0